MSQDLNDFLRSYAIESGAMEADPEDTVTPAGEEEITVITDETQSELEEAVADTAEEVEKLEARDASAEKIVETVESLESFVAQAVALREQGVHLNGAGMQFWIQGVSTSLEARGIPLAIFQDELGGLQTSFEAAEAEDYSTEAEEKGEGVIRKLVNMLVAAVKAVATSLKQFFMSIGKSGNAIKTGGTQLKRIGGAIKGDVKEGDIKATGYGMLVAGSGVDATKAVNDAVATYNSDIVGLTKKIRTALGPVQTALQNPTVSGLKSVETSTAGIESKTIQLAGGYVADFRLGEGEGLNKLGSATFSVKKGDAKGPATAKPLTPSEIVALGGALEKAGAKMIAIVADGNQVVSDLEKLASAGEKAVSKAKDATKEDADAARGIIKAAKAVVSANKGIIPAYAKYMGLVSKQAYNFGKASAGKYGKKVEAKADDAAGKADDAAAAGKKDDAAA